MSLPTNHWLDVPGASRYYQVQGSGPLLMLIGHPRDSSGFAGIARLLADDYTVVSYDPRGFCRSTIDDREQDAEPDMLADDVRRVLESVGDGPAHVLGSSGGAVTRLALVTRHADHVRTLVAHEPRLLLPEAAEARARIQDIYDTYRTTGFGAACQKFGVFTNLNVRAQEEDAAQGAAASPVPTSERFFGHGLLPITLYRLDVAAVQAAPTQVLIGGGTTSRGDFHLVRV